MRLSKERIVLLGVLGAGVTILAVDKTLLGPSGASAATPMGLGAAPTAAEPDDAAAVAPVETPPADDLARRLREAVGGIKPAEDDDDAVWSGETLATALNIGRHWLSAPTPPPVEPVASRENPAPAATPAAADPAAQFQARHKLTAVASGRGPAVAIINGQAHRIGAVIDGFTLTTIGRDSVALERDGIRVQLKVGVGPRAGTARSAAGLSDHP